MLRVIVHMTTLAFVLQLITQPVLWATDSAGNSLTRHEHLMVPISVFHCVVSTDLDQLYSKSYFLLT